MAHKIYDNFVLANEIQMDRLNKLDLNKQTSNVLKYMNLYFSQYDFINDIAFRLYKSCKYNKIFLQLSLPQTIIYFIFCAVRVTVSFFRISVPLSHAELLRRYASALVFVPHPTPAKGDRNALPQCPNDKDGFHSSKGRDANP